MSAHHDDWRHQFPNVASSEDFVYQHPFMFIGYSIALIVVYLIVIAPLYRMIAGPYMSRFEGNLLYTGPGGALDNQMGTCRSDRDGGPYASCGSAEAFRDKQHASHFASDPQSLRNLTERSRFLSERSPDAVYALEQADMDAMSAEIRAISGDDNEAAVTIGMADNAVTYKDSSYVAPSPAAGPTAAQAASRFTARSHGAEAGLRQVAYGMA